MKRLLPQNRGGIWYLVRRVPKAYAHLDKRRFAKLSTGIRVADDPRGVRAKRVLPELNAILEKTWLDLEAGRDPDHQKSYDRVVKIASSFGLTYRPAEELAAAPLAVLMRHIEALKRDGVLDDPVAVDAVLGGVDKPDLRLSELFEAFKEEQAASLTGMSAGQLKKWERTKERPLQKLIGLIGDKSVKQLTREDGLAFRKHFQDRVKRGEIEIGSANKEMAQVVRMLRVIDLERQLGIPLSAFANLRIEGGKDQQRPPFEKDYIQKVLLAEGALDGMNEEARRVVYVMVDTGMRPSEIVNLLPHRIHLNARIPHVEIVPEGRRLKSDDSRRVMPLVGTALAAMKLQPNGFPRYYDKGDTLSAAVNKYLDENGLLPTPKHSLYSLRHSFEDRLTALDPPDKIIARLMGHKQFREKYGKGPTVEHLHGWMVRIALKPPSRI